MGADLSRRRFDPLRDHSRVVLQQGRLLLDADFNEQVEIVSRRIRASIADLDSPGPTPGTAGVAVVPRTTPDAFEISAAGGDLTIGRGRMYVDGLLAENHGHPDTDLEFDPLLAEQYHVGDTPYDEQPYGPVPDLPADGTHMAYLDVWERELTHVEEPDLVDPAIGVDTTARTQTAWQVRLHPAPGATCATPDDAIDDWPEVIAPSPSRLSVHTDPETVESDPCELPPTGGYRGRENQTYRLEIHQGGVAGAATFKWSRDNASVVSPVLDAANDGLSVRPADLGRDAVLGFDKGDWVEVLDDHRELRRVPGDVRKVDDVVDGKLVFTTALDADLRLGAGDAAERHLRVRRWDQNGEVKTSTGTVVADLNDATSGGVIAVPVNAATRIVLESGITVSLDAGGGEFRVGDHWIFVARVADSSVQELVDAPPHGPHHHYARLAIVTFPDTESDCRTLWPPECDCDGEGGCSECTVCVTPESHASGELTIQAAVDQAVQLGGTVCLAAGQFHLPDEGVTISGAQNGLTVRGAGAATSVMCPGAGFQVSGSVGVRLREMTVVGTGHSPCVSLPLAFDVVVERLHIEVLEEVDNPAPAIDLGRVLYLARIVDNVIRAPIGIRGGGEEAPLLTVGLEIVDNALLCSDTGIDITGRAVHLASSRVARNTVMSPTQVGVRLLGTVVGELATQFGATEAIAPGKLDARAAFDVSENVVLVDGSGIEVGGTGYDVTDNEVAGSEEGVERRENGISVLQTSFVPVLGPTRICGNKVRNVGGTGIAVEALVLTLDVSHNLVERTLHGIVMSGRTRAGIADVSHNQVFRIAGRETDKAAGAIGIQVAGALRSTVESNVVRSVGAARESGEGAVGIRVVACPDARVAGNSVEGVGMTEQPRGDIGIGVQALTERVHVAGNTVRRQPAGTEEGVGPWVAVLVGGLRLEGTNRAGDYTYGATEGHEFALTARTAYLRERGQATVTVDGNLADGGRSSQPALLVVVGGDVVANGNQSRKEVDLDTSAATLIAAGSATLNANQSRGGQPAAITIDVAEERLAALGNIVSSEVIEAPQVGSGSLSGTVWDRLNVYNVT